jgi:hypothetical protein
MRWQWSQALLTRRLTEAELRRSILVVSIVVGSMAAATGGKVCCSRVEGRSLGNGHAMGGSRCGPLSRAAGAEGQCSTPVGEIDLGPVSPAP